GGLGEQLTRNDPLPLPLQVVRSDLLGHEAPRRLAEVRVLGLEQRAAHRYRGAIRKAPSSRMTSALSMSFSTMWTTSAAYSSGRPRRAGWGTEAASESRAGSGSPAIIGVSKSPGAIVM